MPVIKKLVYKTTVARWTRTLATLIGAGVPILEALTKEPESQLLRQGAHHVLSDFERHGFLDHNTSLVLDNLRMIGPWEHVAVLAERALKSFKRQSN